MVNATGVLTELDAPGHFSQVWSKKKFPQAGTIFNKNKLATGLKAFPPRLLSSLVLRVLLQTTMSFILTRILQSSEEKMVKVT